MPLICFIVADICYSFDYNVAIQFDNKSNQKKLKGNAESLQNMNLDFEQNWWF